MAQEQIKAKALEMQRNYSEIKELVQQEKEARIQSLKEEETVLKAKCEELEGKVEKLPDKETEIRKAICEKYRHVFEEVASKYLYDTGCHSFSRGSICMYEITQRCICCGARQSYTTSRGRGGREWENKVTLPEEMEKELKEALTPYEAEYKKLKKELANVKKQLEDFPNRYLQEVCEPLGHSSEFEYAEISFLGSIECSCCKQEIFDVDYNLEYDLERWCNL